MEGGLSTTPPRLIGLASTGEAPPGATTTTMGGSTCSLRARAMSASYSNCTIMTVEELSTTLPHPVCLLSFPTTPASAGVTMTTMACWTSCWSGSQSSDHPTSAAYTTTTEAA